MLDYLGDLGGIFEIVYLLAYLLTAKIIQRLYYAAMVAHTYAIQHYNRDTSQYYSSTTFKNTLTSESDDADWIESRQIS